MKIEYLNEIWKDIKGYEGLYQVSNFGRVRSLNYNRTGIIKILKQQKIYSGYLTVYLGNNGDNKGTKYFVHRLVAFAFPEICGEYFEGATVNHKNEIPWDNRAENLHWCTQSFNNSYGTRANRIYSKTKNGKKSKVAIRRPNRAIVQNIVPCVVRVCPHRCGYACRLCITPSCFSPIFP